MAFALDVFVSVVATTAIATVFIVLRFLARRVTKVSLWWDDYMAASAFAFALAWVAVVLRCTSSRYPAPHFLPLTPCLQGILTLVWDCASRKSTGTMMLFSKRVGYCSTSLSFSTRSPSLSRSSQFWGSTGGCSKLLPFASQL